MVFTAKMFLSPISADALVKNVYTATRQKVRMIISLLIEKKRFIALRSIISLHVTLTRRLRYIAVIIIIITTTPLHCATTDMGDKNILAVNTILLQLFTLFSYMNDGFAYAAEALTGRFIGAKDGVSLRKCIKLCIVWCFVVSFIYVGVYIGWWRDIFSFLVDAENNNTSELLAVAEQYIGWIIAIPIASALPFVMDGIMVGATRSRIMRNSMIWSSVCYFVLLYGTSWLIGNNAIWLAFTSYMFLRGLFQYLMSDRLQSIYSEADR